MSDDTDRADSIGRTPAGRFDRGNKFSPAGNPNARKMFELRKSLLESDLASPKMVQTVFSRILKKAFDEKGDDSLAACKIALEYMLGRPTNVVELSGPDGEPLAVDLAMIRSAILGALADQPEARYRVALALFNLGSAGNGRVHDDGAGD